MKSKYSLADCVLSALVVAGALGVAAMALLAREPQSDAPPTLNTTGEGLVGHVLMARIIGECRTGLADAEIYHLPRQSVRRGIRIIGVGQSPEAREACSGRSSVVRLEVLRTYVDSNLLGVRVIGMDNSCEQVVSEEEKHGTKSYRTICGPVPARVVSVTDGDTFKVTVLPLPDHRMDDVSLRIAGIDAPETAHRADCDEERQAGERARQWLAERVSVDSTVYLRNLSDNGGFGRFLSSAHLEFDMDSVSIGSVMLEEGFAERYVRGKKKVSSWCIQHD